MELEPPNRLLGWLMNYGLIRIRKSRKTLPFSAITPEKPPRRTVHIAISLANSAQSLNSAGLEGRFF